MASEWVQVGAIGVDAGLVWVGDPCYIMDDEATERIPWNRFVDALEQKLLSTPHPGVATWDYRVGHSGLGVSVISGYGDGSYPVYVRYAQDGRIAAVQAIFIERECWHVISDIWRWLKRLRSSAQAEEG